MRLSQPAIIRLVDGTTLYAGDFASRIEHASLPWGQTRTFSLPRDEIVLVTGILVVPWLEDILIAEQNCGDLVVTCWSKPVFSAPMIALANRYHGLARAGAADHKVLLDGHEYHVPWSSDAFAPPLMQPICVREGMEFSIIHKNAPEKVHPKTFLIEFQLLAKQYTNRVLPWEQP